MNRLACIVLAAGAGTRMKSDLPKVMHRAAGRTLVGHVMHAAAELGAETGVVVIGTDADGIAEECRLHFPAAQTALQDPPRGTGDAVASAAAACKDFEGTILVLYGADPLLRTETLRKLAESIDNGAGQAVLGFEAEDPTGYGRLLTNEAGEIVAIREQADASPAELAVTLCNSGVMAFNSRTLWSLLPSVSNDNAKGEYYLTDMVELVRDAGGRVELVTCPQAETLGVNTRAELAAVENEFQKRLREKAMADGATLIAPDSVFLSADTVIGRDVVIEPHVFIGPRVSIADNVTIRAFSHLEGTEVSRGAQVGPYARLRPGASVGEAARVGNFVEVKNAAIEKGGKVNHLSYIGDARVGAGANVGAGTITCNYDGFDKHFTDIGDGAFIGSNSALVAPVSIGEGAYIGSGSVITRDVEKDALALARGKQESRDGWAEKFRELKRDRKHGKSK